jgi:hypothetical protein
MTIGFLMNIDLRRALEAETVNTKELERLAQSVKMWHFEIDRPALSFIANNKINALITRCEEEPQVIGHLEFLKKVLQILRTLPFELNLWKAQNIYFSIYRNNAKEMIERASSADPGAKEWISLFKDIGVLLYIHCEFD